LFRSSTVSQLLFVLRKKYCFLFKGQSLRSSWKVSVVSVRFDQYRVGKL